MSKNLPYAECTSEKIQRIPRSHKKDQLSPLKTLCVNSFVNLKIVERSLVITHQYILEEPIHESIHESIHFSVAVLPNVDPKKSDYKNW